ncbi:MAG: reverse transcriptase domain-containing protein [Pseudomonadota bacterium]
MKSGFDKFDGYVLPKANLGAKAALTLVKQFKKAIGKEGTLRDAFLKALGSHGKEAARKRAHQYLKSRSARMAGALQMNIDRLLADRLSLEECLALAENLVLHKPINEYVRVRFKMKSSGGKRPIFAFGPQHKTAQKMVRRLLKPNVMPREWQFTLKGVPAAISYVRTKPCADTAWACTLDIKNFYGSFVDEEVRALLSFLPSKVVGNVVLTNGMLLTDMAGVALYGEPLQDARPGVPQGSAVSPLVGALAVSKLDLKLPPEVCFANYADDFLVIAPSEDQLEAATLAFASAVAELPGGTFTLIRDQFAPLSTGIVFLSHQLRLEDGKWVVAPSDEAISKLLADLEELAAKAEAAKKKYLKLTSHSNRIKTLSAIAKVKAHCDGWLAAFAECDGFTLTAIKDDVSGRVGGLLKGTGIAFDELIGPPEEFEKFAGRKRWKLSSDYP